MAELLHHINANALQTKFCDFEYLPVDRDIAIERIVARARGEPAPEYSGRSRWCCQYINKVS